MPQGSVHLPEGHLSLKVRSLHQVFVPATKPYRSHQTSGFFYFATCSFLLYDGAVRQSVMKPAGLFFSFSHPSIQPLFCHPLAHSPSFSDRRLRRVFCQNQHLIAVIPFYLPFPFYKCSLPDSLRFFGRNIPKHFKPALAFSDLSHYHFLLLT